MKLANVKIGKKMGLLIAASVLQLVCLAGVSLWSVQTLNKGLDDTRKEGHRGALALRISSDANSIGMLVGSELVSHNRFGAATMSRIIALRKDQADCFDDLATFSNSPDGKRRRE